MVREYSWSGLDRPAKSTVGSFRHERDHHDRYRRTVRDTVEQRAQLITDDLAFTKRAVERSAARCGWNRTRAARWCASRC
jgi:hypothetical protein